MLSVSFEYLGVLCNAALLSFEFLSAPLHGYLSVTKPKSVPLFSARLARVDPSPGSLIPLCIFFYWENVILTLEVELHSTVLHLTHYICTSTPHKHTTHSQAQTQARHTAGIETQCRIFPSVGRPFAGFSNVLQESVLKLYCSFQKPILSHSYGLT